MFFFLLVLPAVNYIQDENIAINNWYLNAQRNDYANGGSLGSCCGPADAYWADVSEIKNGELYVTITDDRLVPYRIARDGQVYRVLSDVIDRKRQGNPTGHAIIFIGVSQTTVICYFPNTGM